MPKSKILEASKVRLQKVIADSGLASRRKAEDLIAEGRVQVNGEVVKTLGFKVDPQHDAVMVDGNMVDSAEMEKVYVVLNKPRGYITSLHDPEGRKTIMDLCMDIPQRIFPVGRLDYYSEGLLILTNDGDLANKIIHPRFQITKIYEVKVFGQMTERILKALRGGIHIENRLVKPHSVRVVKQLPQKTWLEFRLMEGKNREIRRFCEAQGLTIDKLRRVAIEGLSIDGIPLGHYRLYSKKSLLQLLGINKEGQKKTTPYKSIKKSVHTLKRGKKEGPQADDKTYMKYRKKNYQQTMEFKKKIEKEKAELIEAEKKKKRSPKKK